jgi:hypothetical protein
VKQFQETAAKMPELDGSKRMREMAQRRVNIMTPAISMTPEEIKARRERELAEIRPSEYLAKLEKGNEATPAIDRARLDRYVTSHLIDPSLLRADDFDAFMAERQKRLLRLIEQATGKAVYSGNVQEEGEDVEADEDTVEAELTIATA